MAREIYLNGGASLLNKKAGTQFERLGAAAGGETPCPNYLKFCHLFQCFKTEKIIFGWRVFFSLGGGENQKVHSFPSTPQIKGKRPPGVYSPTKKKREFFFQFFILIGYWREEKKNFLRFLLFFGKKSKPKVFYV